MAEERKPLDSRAAVRANIDLNSQFDVAYVTMNALATVIACYGLFENSPAVVIGAMIIAMLLGPISGVALGLVDGNDRLARKALATLAGGVAIVYVTAFILGLVHSDFPLTDEIYSRTTPNLMDLMIGLGGGAAGAYSMISPRLSVAFVGVAIATALVPPLSSSALCLARGEYSLALGALLLAFTNIVGIQAAGSVVMWLGGYRGGQQTTRVKILERGLLSVALLCILAAVLGVQLREVISKEVYRASVHKILATVAAAHKGAYLSDVRFQQDSRRLVVMATYNTPVAFTPQEVAALEPKLPRRPGTSSLELRIRSIPVTVSSKTGYLFSSEDLSDFGRLR
jgi:uncharacterized hydrophobic protein (TIGR00271 family)